MAAGGPGGHPISDVVLYEIEVYGVEADKDLARLSELLSEQEIYQFWESKIGWQCDAKMAASKLAEKLLWAENRAKQSGWEQ
jgi:hypothetical protein